MEFTVLGIIESVIGTFLFMKGFFSDRYDVQHMFFICGTIFIVGGILTLAISVFIRTFKNYIKANKEQSQSKNQITKTEKSASDQKYFPYLDNLTEWLPPEDFKKLSAEEKEYYHKKILSQISNETTEENKQFYYKLLIKYGYSSYQIFVTE